MELEILTKLPINHDILKKADESALIDRSLDTVILKEIYLSNTGTIDIDGPLSSEATAAL